MKSFLNHSVADNVAAEPFSREEISRCLKTVKALAMADFAALEVLLPSDSSETSRRMTLRFDAFIRNIENQVLPADIQEVISQQVSMREFIRKMVI